MYICVVLYVIDCIVRKLWGFTVEESYLGVGLTSSKGEFPLLFQHEDAIPRVLYFPHINQAASGQMAGLGFADGKGGAERLAQIFKMLGVAQWELDTWSVSLAHSP